MHLCTTSIEEKEIIIFRIKTLNTNLPFIVTYKGNIKNETKEPKLIKEDNSFKIELTNEYYDIDIKDSKLQFIKFDEIFYIYITNDIYIPIIFNTKITPFKLKVTTYDFNNHEIPKENYLIVYYGRKQLNNKQKLFFKITIDKNTKTRTIKIEFNPEFKIIQQFI